MKRAMGIDGIFFKSADLISLAISLRMAVTEANHDPTHA
jgi:hypothetical protein